MQDLNFFSLYNNNNLKVPPASYKKYCNRVEGHGMFYRIKTHYTAKVLYLHSGMKG